VGAALGRGAAGSARAPHSRRARPHRPWALATRLTMRPPARPATPHPTRILRQVASGSEKGLQAEVLKRDFSREVRNVAARTGAGA
jgi:hypothetical protein